MLLSPQTFSLEGVHRAGASSPASGTSPLPWTRSHRLPGGSSSPCGPSDWQRCPWKRGSHSVFLHLESFPPVLMSCPLKLGGVSVACAHVLGLEMLHLGEDVEPACAVCSRHFDVWWKWLWNNQWTRYSSKFRFVCYINVQTWIVWCNLWLPSTF